MGRLRVALGPPWYLTRTTAAADYSGDRARETVTAKGKASRLAPREQVGGTTMLRRSLLKPSLLGAALLAALAAPTAVAAHGPETGGCQVGLRTATVAIATAEGEANPSVLDVAKSHALERCASEEE